MKNFLAGIFFGGLAIAVVAVVVFVPVKLPQKPPIATTQKNAATTPAVPKTQKTEPAPYWPETTTVNLPTGEDFMYVADGKMFSYDGRLYVTRSRNFGERHLITFWKPGGHPGAWEAFLKVQEN